MLKEMEFSVFYELHTNVYNGDIIMSYDYACHACTIKKELVYYGVPNVSKYKNQSPFINQHRFSLRFIICTLEI